MSEVMSSGTDLTLIDTLTPAVVFREGGVRSILDRIKAEVAEVEIDISTPRGRKECASLAYKVARSKTALDKMGKDLTDQWRKQAEAVHVERRTIIKELDALAEQVRAPLTEWENADKARIDAHEAAIAAIESMFISLPAGASSDDIASVLHRLRNLPDRDWQEFKANAAKEIASTTNALTLAHQRAVAREEAERAELQLRAEEEERQCQEAARAQADREALIAAEAAERARVAAERKAADEAAAAERTARAERDQIEAKARADAEAAQRREREAKEAIERAERDRAAAEQRAREAEAKAERDRKVSEGLAEQRRVAAERQREADLEAAAEREERARREAAEAERHRIAQEEAAAKAAAEARERNVAHKRKINREAVTALATVGLFEEQAIAAVTAIAQGKVPHVSIAY